MRRSERFTGRARWTVLTAVVAFLLMQAALRLTIDHWRPEMREPTFEIKYRHLTRRIEQHSEPPAVVVFLGSSITAQGIDAQQVEAPASAAWNRPVVSYNLGTNGGGPYTNLMYLQRLLRRGVRPSLVVIELSPLAIDDREIALDLKRLTPEVLEYSDLTTAERYSMQEDLRKDWWQCNLMPAYGHRQGILNHSARLLVPFKEQTQLWKDADAHGFQGRDPFSSEQYQRNLPEIEARFKERLANYKLDPVAVTILDEMSTLLVKERIATVLVRMPEGPLMRSYYAAAAKPQLQGAFAALAKAHHALLIDANDWLGDEHFRDSYHLHRDGARVFTQRLLAEMARVENGPFQKAPPGAPIAAASPTRRP
jgi:hypothetical protein